MLWIILVGDIFYIRHALVLVWNNSFLTWESLTKRRQKKAPNMKTLSHGSRSSKLKDFKYAPTQFPLEEFRTDTHYNPWAHNYHLSYLHVWASLIAQLVKNPPAMQETLVWFLGWEDPLEKG